ncbi:hypothetical protein H0H92_004279 [Tricholoma furcatifolium]|nr:hypothetical protein H0H92_004279 [Tricholoma furcatifolium]
MTHSEPAYILSNAVMQASLPAYLHNVAGGALSLAYIAQHTSYNRIARALWAIGRRGRKLQERLDEIIKRFDFSFNPGETIRDRFTQCRQRVSAPPPSSEVPSTTRDAPNFSDHIPPIDERLQRHVDYALAGGPPHVSVCNSTTGNITINVPRTSNSGNTWHTSTTNSNNNGSQGYSHSNVRPSEGEDSHSTDTEDGHLLDRAF